METERQRGRETERQRYRETEGQRDRDKKMQINNIYIYIYYKYVIYGKQLAKVGWQTIICNINTAL